MGPFQTLGTCMQLARETAGKQSPLNASSWLIPDSDQVHTSFIQMAAPLMGRNVTVGVKVAF